MSTLLPFVITGLAAGSVYGMAGIGLVLTYKTSGVFNFAHGAIAAVAAYGFYVLHVEHRIPWAIAAALTLLILGPIAGMLLEVVARRLSTASPAMQVVGTVGLMLLLQGGLSTIFGNSPRQIPAFLPTTTFKVVGVYVGYDKLIVFLFAAASALGLYAYLRFTRLGVAMRAVVEDGLLLDSSGIRAIRVRRVAWVIGAAFAGLSGILISPQIGLDARLLTLLVVQAFGAAAIGRFTSLPITHAGGLALGVAAALATKYIGSVQWLIGLPSSLPFIVLFVALVLRPPRRVSLETLSPTRPAALRSASRPRWVTLLLVTTVVVAGATVPSFAHFRQVGYSAAAGYALIFMSLALLVKAAGQVSLCQAAFAAIGISSFSHFASWGMPWPIAFALAGLVAVPVGAVVAIPAVRLSGIYLALATFGYGLLIERLFYPTSFMFGTISQATVRRPSFGSHRMDDTAFYYLLLVAALVVAALIWLILRTRLGRLLRGLADSPLALTAHGGNVSVTLVIVFCLSALLAALGGVLVAANVGGAGGGSFTTTQSLTWLVVLALAGRGPIVWIGAMSAAMITVIPAYLPRAFQVPEHQAVLFGASALLTAMIADLPPRRRHLLVEPDDGPSARPPAVTAADSVLAEWSEG